MKSKEELNIIKEEVESLNKKLDELSEEELEQVNGGDEAPPIIEVWVSFMKCNKCQQRKAWRGRYDNGKKYNCPFCDRIDFECQSVKRIL